MPERNDLLGKKTLWDLQRPPENAIWALLFFRRMAHIHAMPHLQRDSFYVVIDKKYKNAFAKPNHKVLLNNSIGKKTKNFQPQEE